MSNNPTNYINGLPRVSSIVEFLYPFHGESKDRFHSWLEKYQISLADYMKEASTGGTYVHKAMEVFGLTGKWRGKKYQDVVNSGIQFYYEKGAKLIEAEKYIKCKEYQGTLDGIVKIDGEEYIIDWKTYGLAKMKYGLVGQYRKPYDKLKKARLQLSLYNRALKYKYKLAVIELTEDGYHFHPLEQLPKGELEEVLLLFNNSFIDEI